MDNIVKFYPKDAASDPDSVLEQAVGKFADCLIIGYDKEGYMDVRGTTGLKKADLLLLSETFSYNLVAGNYDLKDSE